MSPLKKRIITHFVMSYPAMSVNEFEHFKGEKEVLEYWKTSSIYLICQRPVLYFDEIVPDEETGIVRMKIKQRNKAGELSVELGVYADDEAFAGNRFMIEVQFYSGMPKQPPFMDAAGIKYFNEKREFVAWLSPERLIYDYFEGTLGFHSIIEGDIEEFLTYRVHYIGQAKNQHIWERLTGHEKLSKALAVEHPFIRGEFSPYELSLIFLALKGTDELVMLPRSEINGMNEDNFKKAMSPIPLDDIEPFAVNDFESYLINLFRPQYNKTLYENYPRIKNGLLRLGFEALHHDIKLFANLITDAATLTITIGKDQN